MSNLRLGVVRSFQLKNTLATLARPKKRNVPTDVNVDVIDLTQELNTPCLLSRHSFVCAARSTPIKVIIEDDDGNFSVPFDGSAPPKVSTSTSDPDDSCGPVVAVPCEPVTEHNPLAVRSGAVAVSTNPAPRNDENDPLGTLGTLSTNKVSPAGKSVRCPLDPYGDHVELKKQVDFIPSRVVPETRCCLLNPNGLCAKCSTSDPEEVPEHLRPSNMSPGQQDIPDRCDNSKDAARATYMHSYKQAASCKLSGKSGQKRKIYECTTAHLETIDGKPKIIHCHYTAVWRQRRKGGVLSWVLDRKASHLEHALGCQSKCKMSEDMLVHNDNFAGSIINRSKSTIKQLWRNGLTPGVTNNSMSSRMLYRARDKLLCHLARDYDNHFDWMETWAREFCEFNPGSAYDIDKDEEGR